MKLVQSERIVPSIARETALVLLVFAASSAFAARHSVFVDATRPGKTMPNTSKVLTVWSGASTDWTIPDNGDYPTSRFVEFIELMSCTGGNAERDLFKNPSDRNVLDDYDFTKLIRMCRGILEYGAKPYLKLGNVPPKFSSDVDNGGFSMNIRPPDDHLVHYRYMKAVASALKNEFGLDEVRTWRYSVLTEADNIHWYMTKDKDKKRLREEFFKLYDYAVLAFEEELGKGLVFGTHLLYPGDAEKALTQFSYKDVLDHCASGGNYATSAKGAPLSLLTISYYEPAHCGKKNKGYVSEMKNVVDYARKAGFTNIVTGVDEGRVITSVKGKDKYDLVTRAVGHSYQAAFDVRVAKSIIDAGAEYCATWGYFSGPCGRRQGVPSLHYFSSRELSRLGGMRRVPAKASGALPAGDEIDVIAGVSTDGSLARVVVGRYHNSLSYDGKLSSEVSVKLPSSAAGKKVKVEKLVLDDRCNWFLDWEKDRVKYGIKNDDFSWSPDDFAIMAKRGLVTERFRALFREKLEKNYAKKAAGIKPVQSLIVAGGDGVVTLDVDFAGNGAAFITFSLETAGR